jgi:hypothetical protein
MNVMTDEEVGSFVKENQSATSLKVDENGRDLYYDNSEANCIELKFPDKPMRVPYFTRVLSLLNTPGEEHFNGRFCGSRYGALAVPSWKRSDGSWLKKCL